MYLTGSTATDCTSFFPNVHAGRWLAIGPGGLGQATTQPVVRTSRSPSNLQGGSLAGWCAVVIYLPDLT